MTKDKRSDNEQDAGASAPADQALQAALRRLGEDILNEPVPRQLVDLLRATGDSSGKQDGRRERAPADREADDERKPEGGSSEDDR